MPGKVKVKISSGKNLPVMDRSSDTTDAYVEIKLGSTTYKTDVCRKSLHPQWNTDWYRFEVDDSELQDEPLQIRLMDHDTYSANDAIGKVYLNLNPLLLPIDGQLVKYGYLGDNSTHHEISGWLPVYDTMHGIRGEVNVTVKVELFSDFNRYRQSSCGVQFFYSSTVPQGYYAKVIHGFVEELLVNDDPEYQWIDKIRTPRASNEARQTLFFKLSGELQRKIGVKALNLGGNAVIGYRQSYDLEGESGIVARGIGTAVTLVKSSHISHASIVDDTREEHTQNYLKFVGGDKSFRLSANPKLLVPTIPLPFTPYPIIQETHPKYKQLSKRLYCSLETHDIKTTDSNPTLTEHPQSSAIKTLLKQEDKRGKPSSGLSQRLKSLKYSQNSLSKKMTALKSKCEEIDEEPGLLTKRKSFKKGNESSVMAELLARSVIQAHNSLSCILEVKNTHLDDNSDDLGDENTLEKLEPIANLLNKTSSGSSIHLQENTSEQSSTSESSSTYSDDDYDYEDETQNYDNSNIDIDTISNIVKDVEMIQRKNKAPLQKQYSLPALGPNRIDSMGSIDNVFQYPNYTATSENALETYSDLNRDIKNYESNLEETESDKQTENFKRQPEEEIKSDFKGIASEAINEIQIEQKRSLIKSAMQAMLLEKVSLIGTYTPPTSPVLKSEIKRDKPTGRLSEGSIKLEDTELKQLKAKIPKSASSVSFDDYLKHKETVLGVPFTSITSLISEDSKRLSTPSFSENVKVSYASFKSLNMDKPKLENQNCFSDTQLDRPLAKTTFKDSLQKKNKRKFSLFYLKRKTLSDDSNLNKPKKRFSFLHRTRKPSESSHRNIITKFFHKTDKILIKNDSPNSPEHLVPPITSPVCVLTDTNQNNVTRCDTTNEPPVNIKIEGGKSSINKHACVTPSRHNPSPQMEQNDSHVQQSPVQQRKEQSPARLTSVPCIHRRSSDSDLSITPKGNSLTGSDRSGGNLSGYFMRNNVVLRSQVHQENFDMLEYPFLTMSKFPQGFISQIGGAVSARSVKRLETITNVDEPESRDMWWSELRMEIRSHARSLNCNAVLGYSESSSICDDICILSACGTAGVIDFHCLDENEDSGPSTKLLSVSLDRDKTTLNGNKLIESPEHVTNQVNNCTITHLPYDSNNVPIKATSSKCVLCHKGRVPEVLIATIEPPDTISTTGRGCFIDSYICRPLKDVRGESIAKEISDGLPFLEYELHRLLINKLKIKGMNAIFGLKFRISVGDRMIIGIATGTALFLDPLPSPVMPKLISNQTSDEKSWPACRSF